MLIVISFWKHFMKSTSHYSLTKQVVLMNLHIFSTFCSNTVTFYNTKLFRPPTKEGLDLEIQSRSSVGPFGPVYLRNQAQEFLEILHQNEVPYRLTFDNPVAFPGGFLGSKMPLNG